MKWKMKRLLGLFLSLALVLGMFPGMSLTVYATEQNVTFTASGTQNGITVSADLYYSNAFFVNNKNKSVYISSSGDPITRIVLTDANLYPNHWDSSYLSASAGTVSFDGSTMTVTDINATSVNIIGTNKYYGTISSIVVYYENTHTHSFTYSASGATITATCTAGCPDSFDTTPAMLTIAAEGGTYDGTTAYSATVTNNIPEVTGDTVGDVAYYKVDTQGATTGGTVQTGAPTGAGYYYASVTLTSGSNTYTAVKAFTVAKIDPTAPTGLTATYGQKLSDVVLPTGWTWADSTQSVGNVVSPAATFKANFAGDDNYNAASNVDVTVTVSKADATTAMQAASVSIAGTSGKTATVSYALPDGASYGAVTNSNTEFFTVDTTNGLVLTAAKSWTASDWATDASKTFTVAVSGATNYNDYTLTVTVTPTYKATQTITADDVTAIYGDTGKKIEATTTGDGGLSYAVKSGDAVTVDASGNLTIVKAGSAVITVTAAETDTYAQATKDVNVTVNTKAMTVSAEDVNVTVDGQAYGITVTVTDPTSGATVKYGTEEGSYTLDESPTQTEVGKKTVYYQVTADNYTAYTGSAKVTVSAKQTQTITAENVTAAYGDTGKSIEASTSGDGTLSYAVKSGDAVTVNETTGALTIVKAGSAIITVTASETATYEPATKEVTVTINKANAVSATVTANNRTYDGTEQPLVTVTGTPTGGTMQYALGTATEATEEYTTSIPTKTNAGTYYVWYKVAGDANHTDSTASSPIEVKIEKAANTVTVALDGWTYGDTANTPTATASYGADGATFTYSTSADGTYVSEKPVNAGTYYVKATIAESTNYKSAVSEPVSFAIARKALTDTMLTLSAIEYEHDGNEKTPTITVKDGNTTLTADTDYAVDNSSTTSNAAYGTYKIKVNGINNYTGSVEKEWKILDHTNPAAEIKIEENTFNTVLNTITFGLFFNKTETVTITATDAGSGVAKIEYLTSTESATTKEAIDALTGTWTTVTNKTSASFSEDPEKKFIVYAKVTDVADNVTYVTSEGVVLDTTAPVIKVDDALPVAEYNRAVSWAATDENLKDVVITFTAEGATAGKEIYNNATTGAQIKLESTDALSDFGSYTIKATDKVGNPKEVTFAITGRDAVITGKADSITYEAGKTYDLSQLFTVESGVTVDTYEIVANADTSVGAGAGTITGSALTVTKAGLITIKATVAEGQTSAATPEYIKETAATGTLTVSRATGSADISINDVVYGNPFTVVLDSTNAGVTPETRYTMMADAAGNEIPAASRTESTEKPVNVGTYKAVVTYEATGLYKEVSAGCTFKITPAVLTVTAEAKEKTYGNADPALTYTVAGLAYEDKAADVLTGALARAEGENAGLYAIGQGTLKANSSYTISYTGASLTIGKAAVENKTVTETVEVSSAGVKDKTIDLKDYLVAGAALAQKEAADGTPASAKVETAGALADLITPGTLKDGVFTYSVAENDGGLTGQMILTISSLNYADYTITINLASAKKVTEVVVESEGVTETAVETVEVPALEDYTEAQPEATVEVKMEVKLESEAKVEEKIGTTTLNKIEESVNKAFGGVNSSELKKEYLDVTVTKSVNGGEAQEIADVNRVLEIAVGYDLTGKYNPIVVREHSGAVSQFTKLSSRPTAGSYKDGTFYVEGSGTTGRIYIYARYFSTYTVAYTTTASYQVTFDDATGDAKQDSNVTQVVVATGTKVAKPADPKRDGYDFDGWYVNGTNTKWNFDTAVTSDITLVAHWDEEDDDDDEVVATPAPVVTAAPRSPKTSDALPGYAFWLILAAAGAGVCLVSAKGRKKEQE